MDVVVTVPKDRWAGWVAEGDLPGDPWSGKYSYFSVSRLPDCLPEDRFTRGQGDRVYIVAHGRLRGSAPLYCLYDASKPGACAWPRNALVRAGGAVAVTIPEAIPGFRGWRYRWWLREIEVPFPEWRTP